MKRDTKNLQCRNGHWHLRALVNGVRILQSLRTTSLEEARNRRDAILKPLRSHRDERQLLRYVERQLLGLSREEAAERLEGNRGPRLEDAWGIWLRDPSRVQCKPSQVQGHKSHWDAFLAWMRERHPEAEHCRDVTRGMCQEWASDLWGGVRSTGNYNRIISSIRYVFTSVCRVDEQVRQPMESLHKKREADAVGKEPFSEEELRAIFGAPDEEFVRLCAVGLYTTLRLGSARGLRWEMFSPDLSELHAVHEKTGADATQMIAPELREILERVPPERRTGYVCPWFANAPKGRAASRVQEILASLGIQTHRMVQGLNGKSRRACVKGFHSLRHTAITLALQNGATIQQVKRLAGHASEGMQARYTHLGAEDAGRASARIGRFW